MEAIPYIIYGGDTLQDGTECGIETKRRCDSAISFFQKHTSKHFIVILAAGKRLDKPQYPALKEVMKVYLEKRMRVENECFRLPLLPTIIVAEQDGWGTFKESLVAKEEIKRLNVKNAYVHSSWYHIPRILLIWLLIEGLKIRICSVCAPSPRLYSIFTEILSFIKVFRDWYKWKH